MRVSRKDVGEGHDAQHRPGDQEIHERGVPSDIDRYQSPLHAQHELRHEADDEGRHGDHEERDEQERGVDPGPLAQAGDHACGDAQDGLDDHGDQGQPDGHGIGVAQVVEDGAPLERDPEITAHDVADVDEPLDDERLVEVVLRARLGDDCRGQRLVTGDRGDGVAAGIERHGVDEERRAEEDGDHLRSRRAMYQITGSPS